MKNQANKPVKNMAGKMVYETREQLYAKVQEEINARKVDIDRSAFERGDLKAHKKAIKKSKMEQGVIGKLIDMATNRRIRTINVTKINDISLV